MKKVGDLFADLGFREEGSDSVKRAFIENLVKAAGGEASRKAQTLAHRSSKPVPKTSPKTSHGAPTATARGEQLSFDFNSDGRFDEPETPFPLTSTRSAG